MSGNYLQHWYTFNVSRIHLLEIPKWEICPCSQIIIFAMRIYRTFGPHYSLCSYRLPFYSLDFIPLVHNNKFTFYFLGMAEYGKTKPNITFRATLKIHLIVILYLPFTSLMGRKCLMLVKNIYFNYETHFLQTKLIQKNTNNANLKI